ncbi:MAG: hypothetical protein JXR95_05240 [Deltaproteobacteria bacterium]|nr:hypothetical protein [Deltaproteobacteria bacterium]
MTSEIQKFLTDDEVPEKIRDNVALLIDAVRTAVSFEMDLSSDTISVLDYYVLSQTELSDSLLELVAVMTGSYYGEVLRRKFGGQWHVLEDSPPQDWQLRFHSCPLGVNPVISALEVITRDDDYTGISVSPVREEALLDMLENAPTISDDEYYSFAGMMDAMHLCIDFLTEIEHLIHENDPQSDPRYGFEDPQIVDCIPFDRN